MPKKTFPLRLICIQATLASEGGMCFCPCTDWKFHIISHTWTKDARDWSLDISTLMLSSPHYHVHKKMSGVDTYADLFKQHKFAQKPGYTELVKFLHILAADGVEKVWFDSLCINQGDIGEKNREIENMGAYYACSERCYVWCHGIGGGFQLWAPAPSPEFYKLPRWFSRVWTLQEFVLPKKLAFVVGMDKEGLTGYFSYMAFCRSTGLTWYPREIMTDGAKAKFGPRYERSLHLLNSKKHFPCPHCGHLCGSNLNDNSGHVYYVERLSYFDLMEKSSYKSVANNRLPATFWTYLRRTMQRLPSMLEWSCRLQDQSLDIHKQHQIREVVSLQKPAENIDEVNTIPAECKFKEIQKCGDDDLTKHNNVDDDNKNWLLENPKRLQLATLAIREISLRDCSEGHDEDRLLSILALLEIEGKVQLRTGKTLEEQTLDVVKDLLDNHITPLNADESAPSKEGKNNQDILALLCLAQFKGNPTISMSWAPTFAYQRIMGDMNFQKVSAVMFHNFKTIAQISEISTSGLKLQCPFMQAEVIPFMRHRRKCDKCEICREYTRLVPNPMKHFVLEVRERQHYSRFMWVHHDDDDDDDEQEGSNEIRFTTACPPTCCMTIKAKASITKLMSMSLKVWLLLLGQDKLQGCSDPYGLFIVCVGQDTANLHKIGVLFDGPGWDPEKDDESFSDAASSPLSLSPEEDDDQDEDSVQNEELSSAERSHQKEFEAWKQEEKYMQEFVSDDDAEEEEKRTEEGAEEEALPAHPEELHSNLGPEDDEDIKDLHTWEQDLECMQRGRFTVGGFGPYVPLNLFTCFLN
ncbi:hypothetical protein GOP47_0023164 [Adiantum capillus-veneris]|uniref:Heterokaryon incompatibility domain-containing protein n=1 Tax=Adiantum capillus-veneris TaxID=13818 RepID=A0A9D4U7M1_ADICA|nr:hypothetical protein GOP47_0023164 [Adiantum capillus-veneris]